MERKVVTFAASLGLLFHFAVVAGAQEADAFIGYEVSFDPRRGGGVSNFDI